MTEMDKTDSRSDTTTDSSGQSMDVEPSSPINPSTSTNPTTSEQTSNQSRPGTSAGRRRKVPDSVTPNACTHCKKARAKCDGGKPACRRCVQRRFADSCHYELHAKTAKEQMIREIQRLQRKNEYLEEEKDTLGEKNSWIEKIMGSLEEDGQGSEIISRLKRGESHKSIAEWLGRPLVNPDTQRLSPTTEHQIGQAIEQYHRSLVDHHDPRYWTNVSTEAELIEHLVKLYFTWIHPVHMMFDEEHFRSSFNDCSDVYCSSALVNIICAMSCHLLHDTRDDDEQTKSGIESLRTQFLNESRSLMKNADPSKMTSIQTYAIMFLVELGSGHGLMASSHLRLAVENLTAKKTAEQSSEAEEVTAWGILTLHTAWSGLIYQKPVAPISTHANPFANMAVHQAEGGWSMYRQPGDSNLEIGDQSTDGRQSFVTVTACEHAKLYRIVHECILVYCGARGKVSAGSLLDIFQRYMVWKDGLPPELGTVEGQPLPHVLFLHVEYYTALIQLLQPLLQLDHFYQESYEQLVQVVVHHAKMGVELLIRYKNIYTNFYLSPLQLFCMVHLCDAVVRYDGHGETTPRTVKFCLTSLEEAKVGYPLAGSLQQMFRLSLGDYGIPVPNGVERMIGKSARMGPEELLDACTRSTYKQPFSQILPNMEADLGQNFVNGWQGIAEGRLAESSFGERSRSGPLGGKERLAIGSLLNL